MNVVFPSAVVFKRCVDAIAVLVDEAELEIVKEGFKLKATDPSQISMVDFEMPAEAFESFKIDEAKKIGIDFNYFSQIMSRAKTTDKLSLEIVDNALKISFIGNAKRSFSMPLIDISASELPNPKIEFTAKLALAAHVLHDALKDATLVSSHIILEANKEGFFIRANSTRGVLNVEVAKDSEDMKEFDVKEDARAMFPLDYLSDMMKSAKGTDIIELQLRTDAPVELSYNIDKAKVKYFLAPRIESE
ncbi:MAG: proliferating cell nuclear antigen (pcna) [Candidatus Diapherotrites archaeon]|nr:proliferating cell nuclear antigen (pcna) [Candidatus Diapherotrites archaeon]